MKLELKLEPGDHEPFEVECGECANRSDGECQHHDAKGPACRNNSGTRSVQLVGRVDLTLMENGTVVTADGRVFEHLEGRYVESYIKTILARHGAKTLLASLYRSDANPDGLELIEVTV